MKKSVSAVGVALVLMFGFGCGKMGSPTGPSEAVAANTAESSSKTGEMPILSFVANSSNNRVRAGDEVVVEAVVENAVDLYGVAATVLFNNSGLSFVKIEESGFIKQQNTTAFMSAIRSEEPDRLVIGLSSLGKVTGVNGSGSLFRITFKALRAGSSEIEFIDTTLVSSVILSTGYLQKVSPQLRSVTIVIE